MLYLATPSSPLVRQVMNDGWLGCMTTPAQGQTVPDGAMWAADNGRFGKGWPGLDLWFAWLSVMVKRHGTARCLFALAPDVPFDAEGTLAESLPWLPRIRQLGVPAAFAAQDGCEELGVPWGQFDVLFLAGTTEWKLGPSAERLARHATDLGKPVHMGRVNSWRRFALAEWFGCSTADGTYLKFGPDVNLPRLLRYCAHVAAQPSLLGVAAGR